MGHHYNTIQGEGKDMIEARQNAIGEFLREEGTRHSIRDVSKSKMLKRVPPRGVIRREGGNTIHDYTARNEAAPQSEWLEVWEFELHTHA